MVVTRSLPPARRRRLWLRPSGDQVERFRSVYAAAHDASEVAVRDVLTYVWGCGPACTSTAALVDVTSRLAQLKYGLMAHFEAKGMAVDKSLWGATAHIQTVW